MSGATPQKLTPAQQAVIDKTVATEQQQTAALKTGSRIQVRQREHLPADPAPVGNPPVKPGPMDFWIFATVLEVTDAGLRVKFDHPGNRWHAQEGLVDPSDVRTKADILKLRDAVSGSDKNANQMREHFQVQADRLS